MCRRRAAAASCTLRADSGERERERAVLTVELQPTRHYSGACLQARSRPGRPRAARRLTDAGAERLYQGALRISRKGWLTTDTRAAFARPSGYCG